MPRIATPNTRFHRLLLSAAAMAGVYALASAGSATASPICLACHWGGDAGGLPNAAAGSRGFQHPPVSGVSFDRLTPKDLAYIRANLHSGAGNKYR
jgi:hypothetical protein